MATVSFIPESSQSISAMKAVIEYCLQQKKVADADSGRRFEGTISSISYLSEKKDDSAASQSAQYVAYVDFTPDETVRIGMTVIVYVE